MSDSTHSTHMQPLIHIVASFCVWYPVFKPLQKLWPKTTSIAMMTGVLHGGRRCGRFSEAHHSCDWRQLYILPVVEFHTCTIIYSHIHHIFHNIFHKNHKSFHIHQWKYTIPIVPFQSTRPKPQPPLARCLAPGGSSVSATPRHGLTGDGDWILAKRLAKPLEKLM